MFLTTLIFLLILFGGIPALKYFTASFIISFAVGIGACALLFAGSTIGYYVGGVTGLWTSIFLSSGVVLGTLVLIIVFSWTKCSCE